MIPLSYARGTVRLRQVPLLCQAWAWICQVLSFHQVTPNAHTCHSHLRANAKFSWQGFASLFITFSHVAEKRGKERERGISQVQRYVLSNISGLIRFRRNSFVSLVLRVTSLLDQGRENTQNYNVWYRGEERRERDFTAANLAHDSNISSRLC